MSEGGKWSCKVCTYHNFSAAAKCTLCNAPRPSATLISDFQNEEQDIYKMAATMGSNKDASSSTSSSSGGVICSSSNNEASNKWPCPSCTYLNLSRVNRCSQCHTTKKKLSSGNGSPKQPMKAKHHSEMSIELSGEKISGGATTTRQTLPGSPKAAKSASNNDINKTLTCMASKVKWTCKACTYENWPRATKCIMCGTYKGRGSPEIIASTSTSPTEIKQSPSLEFLASGGAGLIDQRDFPTAFNNEENQATEKRLKEIRKGMREDDWLWLNACLGVVVGDIGAIEAFIASGGDPARQLTQEEVTLLNRPSAFEVGYTIVHLAIRFKRDDMLAVLLTSTESNAKGLKRLPSHITPDLAAEIRREISSIFRQRKGGKGEFACQFLSDCVTFALPAGVSDLPLSVQSQLLDEISDKDVQKELEEELVINWSHELRDRLGSRLYALWNRTAGDCLLDSVLQATWAIFDSDNTLRHALSESINDGAMTFYPRWKEYESMHADMLHFSLDETQWQSDWAELLSLASKPGASLEQTHIFALAHILRRPIIVYGVKYFKSFRGETLGFVRFQGVYLPLLWEQGFCWKSPIALAYTRGHFSALIAQEMDTDIGAGAGAPLETNEDDQVVYLPLVDYEGKLLPIPFLTASEVGREESLLQEWLDCVVTKGGCLVALQKLGKRPTMVKQMVDEWLDHYRQISHMATAPSTGLQGQNFSSDGESDQE